MREAEKLLATKEMSEAILVSYPEIILEPLKNYLVPLPVENSPKSDLPLWQPSKRPSHKKNLRGHYCCLAPLAIEQHAEELFTAFKQGGETTWQFLPYGPFSTQAEFNQWLGKMIQTPDFLLYAIIADKKACGMVAYSRINPDHGVIEIAHVHFSHLLKKTAAATETIFLMLSRVMDDLNYRRCEWKCDAHNEDSKKAAHRFGFTYEGRFRQDRVIKGYNRDTDWFSILDREWPKIKERFLAWLNHDNFFDDGRQKRSLNWYKENA